MKFDLLLKHVCALSACTFAGFVLCAVAHADDGGWRGVEDRSLEVQGANNPLDFSSLLPVHAAAGSNGWAIATPDGHIAFEHQSSPTRFLCASFVFSALNGGLPSKEDAPRLVQALRRQAYNLVRLHFVDATLMAGRKKDFDFDPDQLDRLFFLLAELKKAGIYWLVDGMTSDNAAYGDVEPNRYVKKHHAKMEVLTTEAGWQHWATLVEKLWGRKNPYTGLPPLKDPAMLGMILVNEGSLAYQASIEGGHYSDTLGPGFTSWLRQRYNDDSGLARAWQREKQDSESMQGSVSLPSEVRARGARGADFSRYIVDLERRGVARMEKHVRDLGFKGLTTAFDNWGFLQADISRAASGWVDMHSYASLPSQHGQAGSVLEQTSVHNNVARYVRELSNARQWGKPFTVSEWGHPFWNQWRYESALLMPAMAGLQGWDAICQFAETPIQFEYGTVGPKRLQAMYPFGVGGDPIMRAAERLA
ncbi:MAG TPA: beta-galactosidase, partial [Methylophilaceae bacterium]|nr:beta-galactosidase [Methylophilaceae bacterium]